MILGKASWRRWISVAVLVGFLPLASTGCFGRFNLTRKVYRFNDSISHDKWIEWLAFLVLVIVPIYGIAALVDAIVANSIEFWQGRNPILASGEPATRVLQGSDGSVAVLRLRADDSISVSVTAADGTHRSFSLVRDEDGIGAFAADGRLLGRIGGTGPHPQRLTGVLASEPR